MIYNLLRYFIIITLFVASVRVKAQYLDWLSDISAENAGHAVCQFLTIPASAEALGRSPIASIGASDATDIVESPANTAFFDRQKFALTHIEWLMGLRKEFIGFCIPVLDVGTIGLFAQAFSYGAFNNSFDIDENPSRPNAFEYNAGISYARSFLDERLSFGFCASYLQSRLDGDVGWAAVGNVSIEGKPTDWLTAKLALNNAGTQLTYNQTAEPLPVQTMFCLQFLPFEHNPDLVDNLGLEIGVGAAKSVDEPLTLALNTQFTIARTIKIGAGYEYGYDPVEPVPTLSGLSAGFSLFFGSYGIDAGWKYQSEDFGSIWGISAKMQFQEVLPKTSDDFYKAAQRHYLAGHGNRAIFYAKRSLRLNPNLWKAHALISRIIQQRRRDDGIDVGLIYSGNNQGKFLPQPLGTSFIGGLAREATAIAQQRSAYPLSVVISTGNLITSSSHPLKVRCAAAFVEHVRADAAALGPGELDFGLSRYKMENRKSPLSFLSTNLRDTTTKIFISKKICPVGRYNIAVLSAIGHSSVTSPGSKNLLKNVLSELETALYYADVRKANVRVVVLHDSWENIVAAAQSLANVDIIIAGSQSQRFEAPMKIGNTIILSSGSDGQYIGDLTMRFNREGKFITFENRLIPLTTEIVEDQSISVMLRQLGMKIDLEEQGINVADLKKGKVEGTFTFMSDRYGEPMLFLTTIGKIGQFPLTSGSQAVSRPRVSYVNGMVLYRQDIPDSNCANINIMDFTGADKRPLNLGQCAVEALFSPDERWIYATIRNAQDTTTDLVRISVQGAAPQTIVKWPGSSERDIAISPDGASLAFCSNRSKMFQLFIAANDGYSPIAISNDSGNCRMPAWSPDGSCIAYLSDEQNFHGRCDLWVYNTATNARNKLTSNTRVVDFTWSNDSKSILFSAGINLTDYNIINIETHQLQKLFLSQSIKNYSERSVRFITVKGVQKILYTRQYENGKRKIYWANIDGSDERLLINSVGNDWLE